MKFATDFINMFGNCETPAPYLRWSAISMAAAALGRGAHLNFGSDVIYPNQYILLLGSPGARKAGGIKTARAILSEAGYENFAPDRARKEAFWEKLQELSNAALERPICLPDEIGGDLDVLLGFKPTADNVTITGDIYIPAGELVNFINDQDLEFIDVLVDLWDNKDQFEYRRATKPSVFVHNPTINLLGATTPSTFTRIIPAHAIGGGFMRRLILVVAERQKKVTIPDALREDIWQQQIELVEYLLSLRATPQQFSIATEAEKCLNTIYHAPHFLRDRRFEHYVGVRLTHLLKLCLVSAATSKRNVITAEDVVIANTILARAEMFMPAGIGHFGYAKNSGIASLVLEVISRSTKPLTLRELHKQLGADVASLKELQEILKTLQDIDKIKRVASAGGGSTRYVAYLDTVEAFKKFPYIDLSILHSQEQI